MDTIIYRIECDESMSGPYTSYKSANGAWTIKDHNCPKRTPTPYMDIGIRELEHYFKSKVGYESIRHGFISMHQLKCWFDEAELLNLSNMDFKLVIYTVPTDDVLVGKCQTLFSNRNVLNREVQDIPVNILNLIPMTIWGEAA